MPGGQSTDASLRCEARCDLQKDSLDSAKAYTASPVVLAAIQVSHVMSLHGLADAPLLRGGRRAAVAGPGASGGRSCASRSAAPGDIHRIDSTCNPHPHPGKPSVVVGVVVQPGRGARGGHVVCCCWCPDSASSWQGVSHSGCGVVQRSATISNKQHTATCGHEASCALLTHSRQHSTSLVHGESGISIFRAPAWTIFERRSVNWPERARGAERPRRDLPPSVPDLTQPFSAGALRLSWPLGLE